MKAEISLPILQGSKLRTPYATFEKDGVRIEWEYQRTSWACQGNWAKYEVYYDREDYDFDKSINALNRFILSEYPYLKQVKQ